MGISLILGGSKPLPGCFVHLCQNGDLANLLKSARKKSAPECPFECGEGGGNRYLGNAQMPSALISVGLPLHADTLP